MRILVACEFSGIVRDAFLARGHDAASCDLLPTERPAGPHYQGDVRDILLGRLFQTADGGLLREPWDLLIAHPPCTYLANSGVRWLYGGKRLVPDDGRMGVPAGADLDRWVQMELAADFFASFLRSGIRRVAVENPIMHGYAKGRIEALTLDWKRPVIQTIQPWQFGHPETKATQLWLRNLPPLIPTNIVEGRTPRVHYASPGPDRWKERSRTLTGIAEAMADQWGSPPVEEVA